jgi:hypothetical protein
MNATNTDPVKLAMKDRLLGLLRKPAQAQKEKRPHNKLWIASLGFNGVMFFLDLVSAVTVALLTNAMYGMMTFLAGFLALLLHENLFTNAHAGMNQKWIAIGGGLLAIVSTIGIGILAGMVNVFNLAALVSTQTIEISMIIGLVITTGIHGILWGVYYFTDEGHKSAMKAMVNAAYRDQQRAELDNAKKDVQAVKAINDEIEGMGDDADLLAEAFHENTGRDLLTRAQEPAMPVEDTVFARKEAESRLNSFRVPEDNL